MPRSMVLGNVISLAEAAGPLYVIAVWGKGRSGKSTFLNALVRFLLEGGFLTPTASVAVAPFTAGAGHTAVTNGIDFIVLPRASGGSFVFLDTEGVGNGEGPLMNAILTLAFFSGGTHVCLNADHIDDACVASAGRVGVAGIGGASVLVGGSAHAANLLPEGVRPSLHAILNKSSGAGSISEAAYVRGRFTDDDDNASLNISRAVSTVRHDACSRATLTALAGSSLWTP